MKILRKTFLSLITFMVSLLALATALVGVIGFVVYLSYTGISPTVTSEIAVEVIPVSAPIVTALMDPLQMWKAPDWAKVEEESNSSSIKYGRELIANTSEYLGPNGKVMKISNGMNCQNCHLQAGTIPLGNNYAAVASTYPKVRNRSGIQEDIQKRINDCFERSLNGTVLPVNSKEMEAMVAYMKWLGKDVPKGEKPIGTGIYDVPLLDRAADPIRGKSIYIGQCQSCHMENGQGVSKLDGSGYTYPPLWGTNSYNQGAGLYRLSRFAGYVRANMPLGATYERPILSDAESWDVAAYINSLDRPSKNLKSDWPDISKKPMDHPFGPYLDEFSEEQHKFGPFQVIQAAKAESK
jgi:thiosulfate dehydrogenase